MPPSSAADFAHTWVSFAEIGSAFGTVAATLAALFGQSFRKWLAAPKLFLELDGHDPYFIPPRQGTTGPVTGAFYYHLVVRSKNRLSPVTGARVHLLSIEHLDSRGHVDSAWRGWIPMHWSFSEDVGKTRDFGPDARCDLFSIGPHGTLEMRQAVDRPKDQREMQAPINLRLALQAQGLQGDSPILYLRISWNGEWSKYKPLIKSHLQLRVERPNHRRVSRVV